MLLGKEFKIFKLFRDTYMVWSESELQPPLPANTFTAKYLNMRTFRVAPRTRVVSYLFAGRLEKVSEIIVTPVSRVSSKLVHV